MQSYDTIVIGAGVVGTSVAYHLARLGAGRVLLLEREQVGAGTTSQSSGILRTHYSVPQNIALAQASWAVLSDFAGYLDDPDASAGLVPCGYLIAAPEGTRRDALAHALAAQQAQGIAVQYLDAAQAHALLPIARLDEMALIGFEPQAGFADATMVATGFARAARRLGVHLLEGVPAQALLRENGRICGVRTGRGDFHAGTVVSTQNIWTQDIERWTGLRVPLVAERHAVLALQASRPYTDSMPVYKDLASDAMFYCRSYGRTQMLVSAGTPGERLATPDHRQGGIPMEHVIELGEQVAHRFPSFGDAGLAASWTGVYDVTPDWNPVLGRVDGADGLVLGYGFSGHGFKLSPAVGRVLAQEVLGQPTDVALDAYGLGRFARGELLLGRYGAGAVS